MSSKEWLGRLLDGYLSTEHVNGEKPCPLAFLAMDIASQDETAKKAYALTYKNMNKIIINYAGADAPCNEKDILSLTSMIIGAVAVSRMINDKSVVKNILASCRQQVRLILGGIIKVGQPVTQLPPHKSNGIRLRSIVIRLRILVDFLKKNLIHKNFADYVDVFTIFLFFCELLA